MFITVIHSYGRLRGTNCTYLDVNDLNNSNVAIEELGEIEDSIAPALENKKVLLIKIMDYINNNEAQVMNLMSWAKSRGWFISLLTDGEKYYHWYSMADDITVILYQKQWLCYPVHSIVWTYNYCDEEPDIDMFNVRNAQKFVINIDGDRFQSLWNTWKFNWRIIA